MILKPFAVRSKPDAPAEFHPVLQSAAALPPTTVVPSTATFQLASKQVVDPALKPVLPLGTGAIATGSPKPGMSTFSATCLIHALFVVGVFLWLGDASFPNQNTFLTQQMRSRREVCSFFCGCRRCTRAKQPRRWYFIASAATVTELATGNNEPSATTATAIETATAIATATATAAINAVCCWTSCSSHRRSDIQG